MGSHPLQGLRPRFAWTERVCRLSSLGWNSWPWLEWFGLRIWTFWCLRRFARSCPGARATGSLSVLCRLLISGDLLNPRRRYRLGRIGSCLRWSFGVRRFQIRVTRVLRFGRKLGRVCGRWRSFGGFVSWQVWACSLQFAERMLGMW